MSPEKFEQIVAEALDELPEKFRRHLHNVAIIVEDQPSAEQRQAIGLKKGYSLYGLFQGFSQAKRLNFGAVLPDRITIFRQPILRDYGQDERTLIEHIKNTVRHEIAHHFGSDEKGARAAEK